MSPSHREKKSNVVNSFPRLPGLNNGDLGGQSNPRGLLKVFPQCYNFVHMGA
jgi:hypothetical protein